MKPDLTPVSRFPDLEKPGRESMSQLLGLFILPTRGDILTRGADYLKRLAIGSANTLIMSDGTDLAYKTMTQLWAALSGQAGATVSMNAQDLEYIGHIGFGNVAAVSRVGLEYAETFLIDDNNVRGGAELYLEAYKTSAAYTSRVFGLYFAGFANENNTQNWTNTLGLIGFWGQIGTITGTASAKTITGAAAIYAEAPDIGEAVNDILLTNYYGLYIDPKTLVANMRLAYCYGIYIGAQAGGVTLNYAIYTAGGAVYHVGDLTAANIITAGNVDGRDVSVDGTKLDLIEAQADRTDATNVAAAGAVMDADFTAADEVMVGTGAATHNQITLAALQILGKKAAGAVTNCTMAELWVMLSGAPAAAVDMEGQFFSDMPIENGATVPASPRTGEMFLHTPTGRNVLMMYDGSNWIPIISLGSMTMYVDNSHGSTSDAIDSGYEAAHPFETVQYAVDMIPTAFSGNVIIYVDRDSSGYVSGNQNTYNETVTIQGKSPSGDYTISIMGNLADVSEDAACDSTVKGTGATQGTLTDTGQFTGDTYSGFLLIMDESGEYTVIDSHTNDVLTLVGVLSQAAYTDKNYEIRDWGTDIDRIDVAPGQKSVKLYDLLLSGDDTWSHVAWSYTDIWLYRCKFTYSLISYAGGVIHLYDCYVLCTTSSPITVTDVSKGFFSSCFIKGSHATGKLIYIKANSFVNLIAGTILDGASAADYGMYTDGNSSASTSTPAAGGYVRIRDLDTNGIYAKGGAQVISLNIQYSNIGVANEDFEQGNDNHGYIG